MSDDLDIIAQRGAALLIRVDAETARILDCRHERLFPAQRIETALARGYWKPFRGDLTNVAEVLSRAQHVGDESQELSLLSDSEPSLA